MIEVSIEVRGVKHFEIPLKIEAYIKNVEQSLYQLAKATKEKMRHTIAAHRKGGIGKLEKAIDVEKGGSSLMDNFWVGVGNIDKLNEVAPYWYVLNYGFRYKPKGVPFIPARSKEKPGRPRFVPGKWVGDIFKYERGARTGIVPMKPISPINYIETTLHWLTRQWNKFWATQIKK